jgi:dipeptidyl aminopeptidase/acylaminoacyl peptidase
MITQTRLIPLAVFLAACILLLPLQTGQSSDYNFEDMIAYYDYNPAQPLNATEDLIESTFFHDSYYVTFESVHGETVTGNIIVPKALWAGPGPYPAMLYLHGYGGSASIEGWLSDLIYLMELIYGDPYVILAIDAQYHGDRSVPGRDLFSLNFTQDRAGLATTVIDERRALDYLQSHPDVIDDELHLIGISMGAILGALTMSVDHRLDAACLIVGGGDWTELVSNSQLPPAIPMRDALNDHYETLPRLMDMVDPVNTIINASPEVALQMHNGTYDVTVPTGQQLFDAAGPPKEIHWYFADHYTIVLYSLDIVGAALNWFETY